MITFFTGLAAKFAESAVGSYAKKGVGYLSVVPRPVWEALAVIGYTLALFALHQHYANAKLEAAFTAGYQKRSDEDAKALAELERRARTAEAEFAKIAQDERTKHDQAVAANAAAADALRVRGPGAAGCERVVNSRAAAAAGGHGEAGHGQADAAVGGLPDPGGSALIALPFDGAVAFGQQNDDMIAELKAWHSWYPRFVAAYDKLREPLAKSPK